ncbi:MAG: lipoate--protein ligase family protein [Candidatus Thorarchaeota archaeon]|nr:MAG: lipoate--protein ligase family protein [Candidatus Thorarchaeota archaeon]
MSWRLIEEINKDVFRNLAIDESLARTMAKQEEKVNTLRFWRSDSAVVIGRFQCVHKEVNLAYCQENRIAISRRFTGGGTVYHDLGNLNFSICVGKKESYVPKSLKDIYERFIGSVATSLHSLGIPAIYDPVGSCIRISDMKITGTAGWLKRGLAFLHGTLLISADLTSLQESLDPPENQPVYLRDRSRIRCTGSKRDIVTNISMEVANCPNLIEIKEAIVGSIESVSGQSVVKRELTSEEKDTSQVLYQSRYSKSTWNLGTPAP